MKDQIAYLIDPKTCTISEIRSEDGIAWIHKALECQTFTGAYSQEGALPLLYVDDEGLYAEEKHWFTYRGMPQPLVNKAIAMDIDQLGRSVTPRMPIEQFAEAVRFCFPMRFSGEPIRWIANSEPVTIKKLPKVES